MRPHLVMKLHHTTPDSMLSPSLSSPVTSPRFLNLSNPSSNSFSSVNLPLSPRAANLRGVACSAAACVVAETSPFSSSFYEILGISAGASNDEIKAAYRRLARSCHPDVAGGREVSNKSAADAFIKVHAAYSTLSDPNKRADYDRNLFIRPPMMSARFSGISAAPTPLSSFYSSPRRNWESDQCW